MPDDGGCITAGGGGRVGNLLLVLLQHTVTRAIGAGMKLSTKRLF